MIRRVLMIAPHGMFASCCLATMMKDFLELPACARVAGTAYFELNLVYLEHLLIHNQADVLVTPPFRNTIITQAGRVVHVAPHISPTNSC